MRMETDNFGSEKHRECYAYIDQSGLNGDKVIVVSDVAELTRQQAADFARQMLEMAGEDLLELAEYRVMSKEQIKRLQRQLNKI